MKKLNILFLLMFLVLSCDNILETAKITILVPPDVAKLHFAVFEGSISENNLLTLETYRPSKYVTIDVPSGNDRMFLAVAENFDGEAFKSGSSSQPVDLDPGQKAKVEISMVDIDLNLGTFAATEWDEVAGATSYKVVRNNPPFSYEFYTIYEGSETYCDDIISGGNSPITYKVAGYYSYFDIYTIWDSITF